MTCYCRHPLGVDESEEFIEEEMYPFITPEMSLQSISFLYSNEYVLCRT